VGLKVGVRVWFKVNVRFGIINKTENVRLVFLLIDLFIPFVIMGLTLNVF
jgi:hypothetical protein